MLRVIFTKEIIKGSEAGNAGPVGMLLFSLLRMQDNMATPCSVKAIGLYFNMLTLPVFKDAICVLKDSISSIVSSNIKSSGNWSNRTTPDSYRDFRLKGLKENRDTSLCFSDSFVIIYSFSLFRLKPTLGRGISGGVNNFFRY